MIYGVFGKPGSGKTTYLAYLSRKLRRKHPVIYSTEEIKGTILIKPEQIGYFKPEPGSVFLIDEIGTIFNSRDFKKFSAQVRDFFALHRHYDCDIYWVSQTVDVDKSIRNRTSCIYQLRKGWFGFSSIERIYYDLTVDEVSHDLVEGYFLQKPLVKFFGFLFGVNRLFFRPLYYRLFDSHSQPMTFPLSAPDKVVK